ncbi:MAG TPA: hypothetical protein VGK53_14305 [Propionicimonas sp.]|jgi:hypothetical protein
MTIALSALNQTNAVVLRVLDALLARPEHVCNDRERSDLDVNILSLRTHLRVCGDGISEAEIELADDGASALKALRWHLGPDIELASMHRRVHRWLVGGREVVLDSFNGKRTCLRIA